MQWRKPDAFRTLPYDRFIEIFRFSWEKSFRRIREFVVHYVQQIRNSNSLINAEGKNCGQPGFETSTNRSEFLPFPLAQVPRLYRKGK